MYSLIEERGEFLYNNIMHPCDLIGIYGELAELIGIENAVKVYENFKGQQVSFPMRLYTKDYVVSQVTTNGKETIKSQATRYGYSERRLRQIIKESEDTRLI